MANENIQESTDEKKIRFKSKNDPKKQDPRSVSAQGKSAVKKDGGNITLENSPDAEEQDGTISHDATLQGNPRGSSDTVEVPKEGDESIKNDHQNIGEEKTIERLSSIKEEDLVTAQLTARSLGTVEGEKPSEENDKQISGDQDTNKAMEQRSFTSITEPVRQSMETLQVKDDEMKRVSHSSDKNLTLDEMKRISNESDRENQTNKAIDSGDDHSEPKDELDNVATREGQFSGEIERREDRVSDHNDDRVPGTKVAIKVRKKKEDDQELGTENGNAENGVNGKVTEEQMRTAEDGNNADSANTIKQTSDISIKADSDISMVKSPETAEGTSNASSTVEEHDATPKEMSPQGDEWPVDIQEERTSISEERINATSAVSAASANTVKKNSDTLATTETDNLTVKSSETAEVTDASSKLEGEGISVKGIPPQEDESPAYTQDNYDSEKQKTKGLAEKAGDSGKDGNDDGLPISLERTAGSEDMKINELKNRVRPGEVFVIKGDADGGGFSVKWAEKRKVLAYKVGSRNTSRFSTLLTETVEQLEKASVRNPSIISALTHPKTEAKGSLLSTYFAGANAKQIIKDNNFRDVGTITDYTDEVDSRQGSPEYDYNFFGTKRERDFSPEQEAFGGAGQPTTGANAVQSNNNNNYPFLTDYDVDHERGGSK